MATPTETAVAQACPHCAGPTRPYWPGAGPHGFRVHHCPACALAFTVPWLEPAELASWYPTTYYGRRSLRFHPLLERAVRWLARQRARRLLRLKSQGTVLDVGCGRGQMLAELRAAGWDVQGVELNEEAARYAREVLDLPVTVAPFDAGQYRDQQFDAVILWHVLEHIPDAPAALEGIARIVKPGGLLWVALPNLASWQAAWTRYAWFHLDLPRHCWHFSAGSLQQRIEALGFEIVHTGYASLDQNVYGWIQSTLNACGLPHNLLYDLIRRDSARMVSRPLVERPWASLASLVGLAVLLPPALLMLIAESIGRRGATVEIIARRTGQDAGSP